MMRILFALPGLHRFDRGAEVALISVASELQAFGHDVTLIGSGPARQGAPYRYLRAPAVSRRRFERFPRVPVFRSDTVYEEASFTPGLLLRYNPVHYDITVTCSFPFINWALRRPARHVPKHVFVTQNGDWPALSGSAEFRSFSCDGLVCTNPDYFERNRAFWKSTLIPNGVDVEKFSTALSDRMAFGIPEGRVAVLMVSALIPSKRVANGIAAVSRVPKAHLVVAGDGPLRAEIDTLANELLPGRYSRLTLSADEMPRLYRSCDAFLHLSADESFGNVYLEALAGGLPIVAIDTARTRWILGREGFLAKRDDPAEVAMCLSKALAVGGSKIVLSHIDQFRWSVIARSYERFFKEILATEKAPYVEDS
jgi:glycosyltransferase involved in cell wall biosynthesis